MLACLVAVEARRGNQSPWNCSHGWLGATMWVLELGPGSSTGIASAVGYRAIIAVILLNDHDVPAKTLCLWP